MALSSGQVTRIAVGGPGLAYAGFSPKSETAIVAPTSSFATFSVISSDGPGVRANIASTSGADSEISQDGLSVRSNMSNAGLGIGSGF